MNRLAETAQQEACKSFHGKIMGTESNIHEIVKSEVKNMHLRMDVAGIDVDLQISNYRTLAEEDERECRWCKCDYSFSSGGG